MSDRDCIANGASSFLAKLTIEFSGGAQFLFGNRTSLSLDDEIPDGTTVGGLIQWLTENKLEERPELFIKGDTVRPGLLVLINDADWELMGQNKYQLKSGDTVHFLSTLHGG